MSKARQANTDARGEALHAKYGESVLEGRTQEEQTALYIGAVMTVLMTGGTKAASLQDSALAGGC